MCRAAGERQPARQELSGGGRKRGAERRQHEIVKTNSKYRTKRSAEVETGDREMKMEE